MIELTTGLPGHGKTLYTVAKYAKALQGPDGTPRAIYYHGIAELRLPWIKHDPQKWQDLPPGSVLIVDEAQFVFPLRGKGEPPEWIAKLATHRHRGIDVVLITQDPMLLDSFVRRLVDRHFHVVRKFGTRFATIHEYANGVRESVAKSRGDSIKHEWRYPEEAFDYYKSAELHTVKRRVPARVWLLMALVLGLPLGGWYWWHQVQARGKESAAPAVAQAQRASAGGSMAQTKGMTLDAYLAQQKPRVPGLAYTAPVYDKVTEPVEAPYPAGCVVGKNGCRCYSQQATVLEMEDHLCRSIVDKGFFVAWKQVREKSAGAGALAPVAEPPKQNGGYTSLGGRPNGEANQAPAPEAPPSSRQGPGNRAPKV